MSKNRAILLILLGGTCMSFVGVIMRLIGTDDGLVILFYRSMSLAAIVAVVACLRRRVGFFSFVRSLDATDVAIGVLLAVAFITYVYAMLLTSIASTLFLLTTAPFMAAIIGWAWIKEKPHPFTWVAMAAALLGVGVMISDGLELGRTLGNVIALTSALFFSIMLVLVRRSGKDDVLGGTFLGGLFACIMAGIAAQAIGFGLAVTAYDLGLILFMGAFTIGIGIAFVTWGSPYVPAAEVSLLVLIESVLGPVWPWLFLGEAMTKLEIIGGLTVMGAVALLARISMRTPAPIILTSTPQQDH